MDAQSANTPTIDFTLDNIVKAFEVLGNPDNSKEVISQADSYLNVCEKNP